MDTITIALLKAEELITHHIGDTPETRETIVAIKEALREVHWQQEAEDLLAAAMAGLDPSERSDHV
jgi:hypothetical protein